MASLIEPSSLAVIPVYLSPSRVGVGHAEGRLAARGLGDQVLGAGEARFQTAAENVVQAERKTMDGVAGRLIEGRALRNASTGLGDSFASQNQATRFGRRLRVVGLHVDRAAIGESDADHWGTLLSGCGINTTLQRPSILLTGARRYAIGVIRRLRIGRSRRPVRPKERHKPSILLSKQAAAPDGGS